MGIVKNPLFLRLKVGYRGGLLLPKQKSIDSYGKARRGVKNAILDLREGRAWPSEPIRPGLYEPDINQPGKPVKEGAYT